MYTKISQFSYLGSRWQKTRNGFKTLTLLAPLTPDLGTSTSQCSAAFVPVHPSVSTKLAPHTPSALAPSRRPTVPPSHRPPLAIVPASRRPSVPLFESTVLLFESQVKKRVPPKRSTGPHSCVYTNPPTPTQSDSGPREDKRNPHTQLRGSEKLVRIYV